MAGRAFFLYFFLTVVFRFKVAVWAGLGIPISFAVSCAWVDGEQSINMISMFAFIMTLGIIVDDTIVVAEQSYTEFTNGLPAEKAAEKGAHAMLVPVMAASLTTVGAFMPLLV